MNLSIDDWRNGRTLTAQPRPGDEHHAGRAVLAYALTHQLDAPATAELLDMLGINPATLKEPQP